MARQWGIPVIVRGRRQKHPEADNPNESDWNGAVMSVAILVMLIAAAGMGVFFVYSYVWRS